MTENILTARGLVKRYGRVTALDNADFDLRPNEILAVAEIPRTLSGKKQELPIKKLLLGQPLEKVVNRDAMANPSCLGWYVEFARQYAARGTPA